MEAVWTRCIPAMTAIVERIEKGEIGEVLSVDVDFGFDGKTAPSRLMDHALGGGALYDLGTYAFHLGTLFAGDVRPSVVHTENNRRPDSVDERFSAVLCYPRQGQHDLMLTMRLSVMEDTSCTAFIRGTGGYVLIEAPFHAPDSFIINGKREEIKKVGHGLHYEMREVTACMQSGRVESLLIPWNESLNWAQTFEDVVAFERLKK